MLVEVPITVQTPPRIAAKESGIRYRDGERPRRSAQSRTCGASTSTSGVLFTNADAAALGMRSRAQRPAVRAGDARTRLGSKGKRPHGRGLTVVMARPAGDARTQHRRRTRATQAAQDVETARGLGPRGYADLANRILPSKTDGFLRVTEVHYCNGLEVAFGWNLSATLTSDAQPTRLSLLQRAQRLILVTSDGLATDQIGMHREPVRPAIGTPLLHQQCAVAHRFSLRRSDATTHSPSHGLDLAVKARVDEGMTAIA